MIHIIYRKKEREKNNLKECVSSQVSLAHLEILLQRGK